MSNVNATKKKFNFLGKTVHKYSAFSPVIPPASITLIVQTYENDVRVHVTAQATLKFTSWQICTMIEETLDSEIKWYKK